MSAYVRTGDIEVVGFSNASPSVRGTVAHVQDASGRDLTPWISTSRVALRNRPWTGDIRNDPSANA